MESFWHRRRQWRSKPSILDSWWIEGCVEGVTDWAIGESDSAEAINTNRSDSDAASLCQKLQDVVIPKYYHERESWWRIMSHAIALNAPYFNTQRMVQQYVLKAY